MLAGVALLAALAGSASAKALGEWTEADVDASIAAGVTFLDNSANKTDPNNIHWNGAGSSGDITDTGFAIAAIGSAFKTNPADVTPAQLADAKNALQWLIKQQQTTAGNTQGSWGFSSGSFNSNYATSISLMALSFFSSEPGAANAISMGRTFEISWQNAPPATTGNAGSGCTASSGSSYGNCGSWTYNPGGCAGCGGDTSNTGFGVTGLDFSGGVPAATGQANLGWAHAVQELNTNPFATQNDGGGSYYPGIGGGFGCCRSSANNTGTLLFMFAYDGLPDSDAGVQAALKLGQDILDTEEKDPHVTTARQGVYHSPPAQGSGQPAGSQEDGSCLVGATGCDWHHDTDGGYHYSLFALSKGMGSYVAPSLTDTTNFYAKVADLLLSQQGTDGSWAADLRDDGSPVGAAAFSILALSKAGQKKAVPPPPAQPVVVPPVVTPAQCTDTRRFTFKLHHAPGQRVVKVKVYVNGKLVKTVNGRNVKSVTIDTLPQQTFTVKIVAYQSSTSRLESTRVYSGCTKSRPKTHGHHHKRKKHHGKKTTK